MGLEFIRKNKPAHVHSAWEIAFRLPAVTQSRCTEIAALILGRAELCTTVESAPKLHRAKRSAMFSPNVGISANGAASSAPERVFASRSASAARPRRN
jgi:hypothetical protein